MNKGFTLIELLVVVLIIGILSAIGLPQYTAAIERSRSTEVFTNAKAIMDAIQRHRQMYPGENVTSFAQLADVEIMGISSTSGSNSFFTKNFKYTLGTTAAGGDQLTVERHRNSTTNSLPMYTVVYTYVDRGLKVQCTPTNNAPGTEGICKVYNKLSVE